MNYKPKEEDLKEWGKDAVNAVNGFSKFDLEPIFEEFILPFYCFACWLPKHPTNWKIVNRETGEEYSRELATKKVIELRATYC